MASSAEPQTEFSVAMRVGEHLLHEMDESYKTLEEAERAADQMRQDAADQLHQDADYLVIIRAMEQS